MNDTQKVIKYVAIAFAICLIVGIFMGIYQAIGFLGRSIVGGSNHGLDINNYPTTANILSIDIAFSKLEIIEGETLKVETDNEYIVSEQDNNKLSVYEKKHSSFWGSETNTVTVSIPRNIVFDKVYISTGAGTIDIENITAESLELEMGAGKVDIGNMTVLHDTKIEGGAGEVNIYRSNLCDLDLDVGVGKFTLNTILNGESDIDAGVGELNIHFLDGKENYRIKAETGIGSIRIDGDSIKNDFTYGTGLNEIDIDGGIGSINIYFNKNLN